MEYVMEEFLVDLQETKHISENTRVSYKRDLCKLIKYFQEHGLHEPAEVTITDLESYVLYLEQNGFAAASVSRMVASMKAFFKYMAKKKLIAEDISDSLRSPKVEKKKKAQLSVEEVFKLLEQPAKDTDKGIRDRAMMELLYATGIRVSDLISLQLSDINLKLGCVNCRDKMISFGRETQVALAKYISEARAAFIKKSDSPLLFLNCSGTPMSRQGFWKLLKGYAKEAGIQADITTNMIRKI